MEFKMSKPVIVDNDGTVYEPGEGIKVYRKRKGWTQKEFAEKVGCSVRTVEGWDQGKEVGSKYVPAIKLLLEYDPAPADAETAA